jgi:hypothetical protein
MRALLWLVFFTLAGCAAQELAAPKSPPRLDQPKAGADVVSGKAVESAWAIRVKIFDSAGNIVQQRDVLVNPADSSIVAGFSSSLEAGQIVQAYFLVGQAEVMASAPLVVANAAARASSRTQAARALPQPTPVRIRGELVPGMTNVYAEATPTPANSGYEVRLYACPEGVPAGIRDSTGFKPYAVTDATGQAAITFEQPLAAGQVVSLCQKIADTSDPSAPAVEAQGSGAIALTNPLDLGRVRYYFTSGIVLSNDQQFQLGSSGTQAGLYLGLSADRAWLPLDSKGFRRLNVNSYLDVRLTSVATQQAAAASILQSFTQSQKAAMFETGVYVPVVVGEPWSNGTNRYSVFAAPLAKAGFVTLTDDPAGASSSNAIPVTGRFYNSYSYGARFGVFRHFASESAAPQLVSYVDFAAGRFGDFEAFRDLTLEANPNPPATQPHDFLLVRPWRYSFEGVFKVPHSPFILGFSANIGTGAWPAARDALGTHPFTQPRDDLRFLFGAQFDFSQFLRAIPQF